MSQDQIILNTRTGFSSLLNDFIHNESISVDTKGTALYLQSLPPGWKIHPKWVQKKLGFGERVWLRIAQELIDFGYLKYNKGGQSGGSFYVFDAWKYKDNFIKSENDKMSVPTKCGSRKMSLLNNKLTNKKQTKIKNNKQGIVVVGINSVLIGDLAKCKVSEKTALDWIQRFGADMVLQKLKLLEMTLSNGTPILNQSGWLNVALRDNYQPPIKSKPIATHASHEKADKVLKEVAEREKAALLPENRKKGREYLDQLKGRKT